MNQSMYARGHTSNRDGSNGGSRRRAVRAAALSLAASLALAGALAGGGTDQATATPRPNVVVIQTDDQALDQLYAKWITPLGIKARVMPNTLDLIKREGVTFTRYITSYPLCCPSRTTLLSGRYAHSHGVISNDAPRGGWPGYQKKAVYRHNLGVWLQDAGYRTIHIGKFLNNYGGATKEDTTTVVPPGWNNWQTFASDNGARRFYGYELNVNGQLEGPFGSRDYLETSNKDDPGCPSTPPLIGACNYQADVLTQRAVEQIDASAPARPFYLQVDYSAPHGDTVPPIGPEPATRHFDSAADTPLPKSPAFNEGDVSDKPSFIRNDAEYLDPVQIRRIRIEYQKGLESLRSVDEGVAAVFEALERNGELDNTYVIFISDNGFFFGEHRLERSKFLPYEPAIRMPLLIRGPGIEPGSSSGELVANIDLAPTILRLARASATRRYDGHPLQRFWADTSLRTRRPILLESFINATDIDGDGLPDLRRGGAGASIAAPVENYLGVRLGPYKYIEYETGDRELYDLSKDPYELRSRHRSRRYDRVQRFLGFQIRRLEGCVGGECKFTTGSIPKPGLPPGQPISPPPGQPISPRR
jgi:N-acetylglucosamine-6-sulfatase